MFLPFRGVLSFVSLFKKRSCAQEACVAIYYSESQTGAETGQQRGRERVRERERDLVQSNGGLCGQKKYKLQDRTKSEEIDLLDPFPEKEAVLLLSSFPQSPDL